MRAFGSNVIPAVYTRPASKFSPHLWPLQINQPIVRIITLEHEKYRHICSPSFLIGDIFMLPREN
jgi:hypothetical protein